MRREGRMHGSYVRLRRHDPFEYNAGAPRKPTNASRVSGACPNGRVRCSGCSDHPVQKAMSKTKGKFKIKDLDITMNHKLHSFVLKNSSPPSRRNAHYANSIGIDLLNESYDSCSDRSLDDDDSDEEVNEEDYRRTTEMIVTVASFLRTMRTNEFISGEQNSANISEEEVLTNVSELVSPEEIVENEVFEEFHNIVETEDDSGWFGVNISDSEHSGVDIDGWYLVS